MFGGAEYTLSEDPNAGAGYSTTGVWSCDGGTFVEPEQDHGAAGRRSDLHDHQHRRHPDVEAGQDVTNDNGGLKTADDWTLSAAAAAPNAGRNFNNLGGSGTFKDVFADAVYTLSENPNPGAGYSTTGVWSCDGGTFVSPNKITVPLGTDVTCTIINDDKPGTIVIIKNAKPASGVFTYPTTGSTSGPGTSWPASFTLNGDPTGGGNTKTFTVDAGTYTVTEQTQLGWILTGIGGSTDPNTPYNCVVTGSGGSTGVGDLNTQAVTIAIKNGDTVTCTFENTGQGVTRTQGFWATHSPLANIAWFGGDAFGHSFPGVASTPGLMNRTLDPCGKNIDTLGKLMGGFWSDVAKKSTGVKRTALDQARMQLVQQLLAAELNASAFGSVPAGGSGKFAVWEAAYCGTSQTAMQNAMQGAASFNNSGDSGTFTPGTSADSKNARAIADKVFWNVLP